MHGAACGEASGTPTTPRGRGHLRVSDRVGGHSSPELGLRQIPSAAKMLGGGTGSVGAHHGLIRAPTLLQTTLNAPHLSVRLSPSTYSLRPRILLILP